MQHGGTKFVLLVNVSSSCLYQELYEGIVAMVGGEM